MKYSFSLRRCRKLKKLKQQQVAEIMGIKNSSLISRWENGFSLPDLENAFKLAVVYGVMVDALFLELRRSVQQRLGAVDQRDTMKSDDEKR